jgi:hypothetical protein
LFPLVQSYLYRDFFSPPVKSDFPFLCRITEISGSEEFRMPVGSIHPLNGWATTQILTNIERCSNGQCAQPKPDALLDLPREFNDHLLQPWR